MPTREIPGSMWLRDDEECRARELFVETELNVERLKGERLLDLKFIFFELIQQGSMTNFKQFGSVGPVAVSFL